MANYYVDATLGDDGEDGSILTPWQTVAKVNASSFSAGDSILFKKSEVWREQLLPPSSGSAGNLITFGAYGSGELPILNGTNIESTWTSEAVTPGTDLTGDANLQGYWYLDNALTDGTANGNTLTNNGSAVFDATVFKRGTHSIGPLNGSSQYLSRADASLSANFPGKNGTSKTDVTFGCWVYLTALTDQGVICGKGATGANYLIHQQTASPNTKFRFAANLDAAARTINGNSVISLNTWYHVVGRISSATKEMELFVDGVKQTAHYTATSTTLLTTANAYLIGRSAFGAYTTGYIDEAFVFDRALEDAEIVSIYTSGLNGSVGGFTAYRSDTASYAAEPNQVFVADARLTQAASKAAMTAGSFYYDVTNTRVYVRTVGDDDPTGYTTEIGIFTTARKQPIKITGKTYLAFDSLHVTKADDSAVRLFAGAQNITFTNMRMSYSYISGVFGQDSAGDDISNITIQSSEVDHNGGTGIFSAARAVDWLISTNDIHDNAILSEDSNEHTDSAGIRLMGGALGHGHVVEYNDVYDNGAGASGDVTINRGTGIYFDTLGRISGDPAGGSESLSTIRYNTIHGNNHEGIWIEDTDGVQIYYNLIYGNTLLTTQDRQGIYINRNSHNNLVYNNLVYGHHIGISVYTQVGDAAADNLTGNVIKNNAVIGSTVRALRAGYGGENDGTNGSGNVYEYNAFGPEAANFIEWGNGVYKSTYAAFDTAYGSATHSMTADPLFVSTVTPDFHLQAGSPCINAGIGVGLSADYAGLFVPRDGIPDIGAHEYQPSRRAVFNTISAPMRGAFG